MISRECISVNFTYSSPDIAIFDKNIEKRRADAINRNKV